MLEKYNSIERVVTHGLMFSPIPHTGYGFRPNLPDQMRAHLMAMDLRCAISDGSKEAIEAYNKKVRARQDLPYILGTQKQEIIPLIK